MTDLEREELLKRLNLHSRQMRRQDTFHNVGWYTPAGEFLGWGDLNRRDIRRITEGLNKGEAFVILSESDWQFMDREVSEQDRRAFIFKHAWYVILPGQALRIPDTWEDDLDWQVVEYEGIFAVPLRRDQLPKLI